MMDSDEVLNITLNVPSAADADWDLQGMVDGTSDYDDPSTYLWYSSQPASEDQNAYLGFAGGVDNPKSSRFGELPKLLWRCK